MNKVLNFVLNVIWLIFGGLWLALGYLLAGIVMCIFIITIPFGIASFRIAGYALWPFGRKVIDARPSTGPLTTIGNIIWFIFGGLWITIEHIVTSIPMFLSIIGIPLGIANLRMIPVSLFPLGKEVVDSGEPGSLPRYDAYGGGARRR